MGILGWRGRIGAEEWQHPPHSEMGSAGVERANPLGIGQGTTGSQLRGNTEWRIICA